MKTSKPTLLELLQRILNLTAEQAQEVIEGLKADIDVSSLVKVEEAVELGTGEGFAMLSLPLPKDHWIYESNSYPPMPMRIGTGEKRDKLAEQIRSAAKYAVRGATMSGKAMDFDPDALVQNMIVSLLGYWTENGLSDDMQFNPPHTRN